MLKRKLGLLVAASVIVGMFTSCINFNKVDVNDSGNETPAGNEENLFVNYSDYSIMVKNDYKDPVVCFAGAPSAETLISGAAGGGATTGLKKTSKFGKDSFDFVLYVVTKENYEKYKNNWETMGQNVLCFLYAYYNSDAEQNANLIYTISSRLGGQYYFNLNNTSKYNCELRLDGLFGKPFCYAGPTSLKTKIYAAPGDYDFYPVFKKFDKSTGAILTSYPKTANGNPKRLAVGLGGDSDAVQIDCKQFLTSDITMAASATYLKINNQSKTGVKLFQGENAIASITDTGIGTINSGKNATFTIKMDKISNTEGSDIQYEVQTSVSSWKIGVEGDAISIPSKIFEAGYRYVLLVTGEDYDSLQCAFEAYESDDPKGTYKAGDLIKYPVSLD